MLLHHKTICCLKTRLLMMFASTLGFLYETSVWSCCCLTDFVFGPEPAPSLCSMMMMTQTDAPWVSEIQKDIDHVGKQLLWERFLRHFTLSVFPYLHMFREIVLAKYVRSKICWAIFSTALERISSWYFLEPVFLRYLQHKPRCRTPHDPVGPFPL